MLHVYGLTAAVREDCKPQVPRRIAKEGVAQAIVQAPNSVVARWFLISLVNSKGFLVSRFEDITQLD